MGLSLDQFLGHSSSSRGKAAYLSKWKKNTPPQVDVWLHTKALIEPLWRHGLPRLFERTDRQTQEKTIEVWSGDWLCWEEEEVLTKQYMRDNDTGERAYPPVICPLCRLIEFIRMSVETGELNWTTPLFRFIGDDPSKAITINAGGMFNAFNKDGLSDSQIAEMKKAKIFRSEAWRQNMMPKLSYAFSVVDNSAPGKGVQIAIETSLLGDKVKEVIHKAMLEAEDEGNPLENPYAIRWIYRPDERQFNQKYNAATMRRIPLTSEIKTLIVDTAPPDLSKIKARKDPRVLLSQLQSVYVAKFAIPWDEIFGDAISAWDSKGTDFDPDELESEEESTPSTVAGKASKPKKADPVPNVVSSGKSKKDKLCYECGEFLGPNGKCSNCGYSPRPDTTDPDDDLPY